ncbi:hypothetical protein BDZ91DRAFT_708577 [Kalaharituber pfeilii]|nr:hypothetical protein BDZ91DRAFT_708577 [Kalaharituber pfeilii]
MCRPSRIVTELPFRVFRRLYSFSSSGNDPINALSKPSWSVRSLLPPKPGSSSTIESSEITPAKLHHLLRLAALPLPVSPEEEKALISTLLDQLHFVKDAQSVDTTGVSPLHMIRDEIAGKNYTMEDIEPTSSALRDADIQGRIKWDVLGLASRKLGDHFVVDEGLEAETQAASGGLDEAELRRKLGLDEDVETDSPEEANDEQFTRRKRQ